MSGPTRPSVDLGAGDRLESKMAATADLAGSMPFNPLKAAEFDPRAFLKVATQAARSVCKQRFEAFGSAGQASRIKVVPLDAMAARYASGELDALVRRKTA